MAPAHRGVDANFLVVFVSFRLNRAGAQNGFPHFGARGLRLGRRQLAIGHGLRLNVDIDTIDERTADARHIARHLLRRASAFAARVVPITARTRVHRGDEDEIGGERLRLVGAGNPRDAVFKGLAQRFKRLAVELGELVEKKDAVVREADFARRGNRAAADEPRFADRMMRFAERARRDQSAPVEFPHNKD